MREIPFQQDGLTELPADDFNQIPREEENLIQSANITLDGGNVEQMGEAVAFYCTVGDYFIDNGSANTYTLIVNGGDSKKTPLQYYLGLRVRFKAVAANTGASTAQLAALASLPISKVHLGDGESAVLDAGDIPQDRMIELAYDETPDTLTKYWRLVHPITDASTIRNLNLDYVTSGKINIITGGDPNYTYRFGQDDMYLSRDTSVPLETFVTNVTSGVINLNFIDGPGNDGRVEHDAEDEGKAESYWNGHSVTRTGKGIAYSGGGVTPGEASMSAHVLRKGKFLATGLSWSTTATGLYTTGTNVNTDIPDSVGQAGVFSVFMKFQDAGSPTVDLCIPVTANVTTSGGFIQITSMGVAPAFPYTMPASATLIIEYDAASLGP